MPAQKPITSSSHSLREIVAHLRGPNGCPWDKKQNHASLKKYLLEESYECLEAIDGENDDELREELGDVLLQVVLHSQIASERGVFDFEEVEKGISEKMIRRHPHVFGDETISDPEDVESRWDEIKKEEKASSNTELFPRIDGDIPKSMPAWLRTHKIQERASKKSFDWPSIEPVLEKIQEECRELAEAVDSGDRSRMTSELGDLLFITLKAARFMNIDPEAALNQTNASFCRRFQHVEENRTSTDLNEMMKLWQEAKELE